MVKECNVEVKGGEETYCYSKKSRQTESDKQGIRAHKRAGPV